MPFPKAITWQGLVLVQLEWGPNAAILTSPNVSMFIADTDYELVKAQEVHETLGTDGSAVTVDVVKCTTTQAAASGTTMLASTFNLKATINTVVTKSKGTTGLTTTLANRRIASGNRIAAKFTGTLTSVTGMLLQLWLQRLRRPTF